MSSPGPELVLTATTMELAGTPGPARIVTGVTLSLSRHGIRVAAPGGAPVAVAWSDTAGARCGEAGFMPDGSPAVAISTLVAGRLVRWLVPEPQMGPERAVAIDLLIAARTGRGRTPLGTADHPGVVGCACESTGGAGGSASLYEQAAIGPGPGGPSAPVLGRVGTPMATALVATGGTRRRRPRDRSWVVLTLWVAIALLAVVGLAALR